MFPKFAKNILRVEHCGWKDEGILNVPLWNTSGASIWFILNFTDLGHCDHTAGNTGKYTLNEPLWNITGTFFGKIQGLPTDYLIRKPWSCDLGNCECTEHFL